MLTLKMAKENFFDTKKVMRAVDAATRKALSKIGAFVRTRARTSIRTRKATSAPGQPPSSHTGDLKKGILFSYEPTERTVVVGPVLLNKGTDAPALLEYGGETTRERRLKSGKVRRRRVRIEPRPYMGPALQAEIQEGTIPEQFRGLIGAGEVT